jgi:hypothetical protein
MRFQSREPNAMILPLPATPNADENSIRFIDLSGYEDFFRDLGRCFPTIAPRPTSNYEASNADAAPLRIIEVHEVGGFEASFVPSMADFKRLDPRFVIPEETWAKIPLYRDYSFAVFQLKDLEGRPHPMAFEFETRLPDTIFFPTVHIHDGEVHATEDFDHMLYCQHSGYDRIAGAHTGRVDAATDLTRSKWNASNRVNVAKAKGLIDGNLLVHRRILKGDLPNQDVWLAARGQSTKSTFGFAPAVPAAIASLMLPVNWLIRRRNRLQQRTQS